MKTKNVADHIIHWLNAYPEESKLEGFGWPFLVV